MTEQTPPTPPEQPAANRNGAVVGLVVIGGMIVAAIVGAIASSNKTAQVPADQPPLTSDVQVRYEITGSAHGMDITARSATGTEQASGRAVPATLTYTMHSGDFAYVSAQNDSETGDLTCTIRVGDTVISTNTASGAYTIATCEGRIP